MVAMPRILIVDDTEGIRTLLKEALEVHNFEVIDASTVTEALHYIATETFDVLITDLHMPGAGDGFTVVSAMRHTQPSALTMVLSGFPNVQEAMAAIILQADEILVKPLEISTLVDLIEQRLKNPVPGKLRIAEPVAAILERQLSSTISAWYDRVMAEPRLAQVALSQEERTGYLTMLLTELVHRLRQPRDAKSSDSRAASLHGSLRRAQGYTAHMLVMESRILQVSLFEVLHNNIASVDFSLVLLDVMAIADEIDFYLEQTMESYMGQQISGSEGMEKVA
jgi:DNA-binding response OmpR family regulator